MATSLNQRQLLNQLRAEVNTIIQTVTGLDSLTEAQLNQPPAPGKWSVVQIIEHLNTYNRYYIPRIVAAVKQAGKVNAAGTFKPGWLGNYFTKSMYSEVVTGKRVANKMSAMKGHIPPATLNGSATLIEFMEAQQQLLQLLDAMQGVDMSSVRLPITISKFIKISFGDAARFLIAHQVRHQLQMQNTLAVVTA